MSIFREDFQTTIHCHSELDSESIIVQENHGLLAVGELNNYELAEGEA